MALITRILLVLLLIFQVESCSEEPEQSAVQLVNVSPSGQVDQRGAVFFTFRGKPQQVQTNGVSVEVEVGYHSGLYFSSIDIERLTSELGPLTIALVWTDDVGVESSTTLHYEVVHFYFPSSEPYLTDSDPSDAATDVDPTRLNRHGIFLVFSESIDTTTKMLVLHLTADEHELQWEMHWQANNTQALLYPQPGNELGFGQHVVVQIENIHDPAGNPLYPGGVLKLRFTTAEE